MSPTRTERLTLPILPNCGAAGFTLGQTLSEVRKAVGGVTVVERKRFQGMTIAEKFSRFLARIGGAQGWGWRYRGQDGSTDFTCIELNGGVVRLTFDQADRLSWIFLERPYRGTAPGGLGLGSTGAHAKSLADWEWDDGEDMFFPNRPHLEGMTIATGLEVLEDNSLVEVIGVHGFVRPLTQ